MHHISSTHGLMSEVRDTSAAENVLRVEHFSIYLYFAPVVGEKLPACIYHNLVAYH